MYKCVFAITFKEDESPEAMERYWTDVHGPLVLGVPGLVKYVQSSKVQDVIGSEFDGLVELYFEDEAAFEAAMASEYWNDTVVPDGANFLDESKTFGAVVVDRHLR